MGKKMRRLGMNFSHTLFGREVAETEQEQDKKGRNAAMIDARNEHLLYRFCHYRQNPRTAYDWILDQLSKEFYITPLTIGQIIMEHQDRLSRIAKVERPSAKDMEKKYPWMNWPKD